MRPRRPLRSLADEADDVGSSSHADTGVGIPKSEIDRVTERFHRVQSVSRSFEGTGLGLALCSELVQVLGGRLEIESSTAAESPTGESGSTFSVFLKYGRGHLPEGLVDDARGSTGAFVCSAYSKGIVDEAGRWATTNGSGSVRTNSSAGALSTSAHSDSGLSTADSSKVDVSTLFWDKSNVILLVDDSVDMLQYLHGVLAGHCQVLTAGDGDAALKILEKRRVDLVISDIQVRSLLSSAGHLSPRLIPRLLQMPVLDGYGLLSAIRAHKVRLLQPSSCSHWKRRAKSFLPPAAAGPRPRHHARHPGLGSGRRRGTRHRRASTRPSISTLRSLA